MMTTKESHPVAHTIIEQLGRATLAMLGAHRLAASETALMFGIKGSRKANLIRIELAANDTYTVQFWKMGRAAKVVAEHEGVYFDSLHEIIGAETGLYTRL